MLFPCFYCLQHHLEVLEGNQSVGAISLEEGDFCVTTSINTGQPLAPLPRVVNKAKGIMPSALLCYGMVALEAQSLSCYNFNSSFFPTRSTVLRPPPPSEWFLPKVYAAWSPAKFFCSWSLWLLRQDIQTTHIWKKTSLLSLGICSLQISCLRKFTCLFACPHRELLGKVMCDFASNSAVFCYTFFGTTENSELPKTLNSHSSLERQGNSRKVNPLDW